MSDDRLVERQERRVLLDHPQPLGILPTRWFWRTPESRRAIMVPYGLALLVIMLGLVAVDAPLLVAVGVTVGILGFGLGAFERYIRSEALRRRRARDAGPDMVAISAETGSGSTEPREPGDACTCP